MGSTFATERSPCLTLSRRIRKERGMARLLVQVLTIHTHTHTHNVHPHTHTYIYMHTHTLDQSLTWFSSPSSRAYVSCSESPHTDGQTSSALCRRPSSPGSHGCTTIPATTYPLSVHSTINGTVHASHGNGRTTAPPASPSPSPNGTRK